MRKPTKKILNEATEYLIPVIKRAGKIVLDRWDKIEIATQKDKRDVATKADIEVENFLRKKIFSKWPSHGFWGEEGARTNELSPYQWLIDPIDGTKNYVGLAPFFQVHIALVFNNEPVLGLIYQPVSKQLFSAVKNGKTYLNERIIKSDSVVSIDRAIIDVDLRGLIERSASEKKWMEDKLCKIAERSFRLRVSGGSFSIYLVTGAVDAYVGLSGNQKPQDLAARIIIMQEAGFKIERFKTFFSEEVLLVSQGKVFSELKKIILE